MSSPTPNKMFRRDEVEGKIVIETSGKGLGKAKDIAFGLDGRVVLIVQASDNAEMEIPMDRVAGVGDYVVIRRDRNEPSGAPPTPPSTPQPRRTLVQPPPSPPPAPPRPVPTTTGTLAQPQTVSSPSQSTPPTTPVAPTVAASTCRVCGATLKSGARFCTKCGTPV